MNTITYDLPNSDISKQLLQLRREQGLTQKQLADKVGIDQTMISDYEMGKFIPSLKTIKKFAKQGIIIDLDVGQVAQVKDFQIEDYKENEMTNAGEQVIKIRENLGLNQSSFARRIGVSPTTLCEIESGKRVLTAITLRKIKDKTGISLIPSTTVYPQKEEVMNNEIGHIRLIFNIENEIFELGYSSSQKTQETTSIYTLIINQEYFDFLKLLLKKNPNLERNLKVDNIQKVLLLVSCNKTNFFYTLKIIGDTTGIVPFKASKFEDIIEKPDMKEESNAERDILILCQNIIQIRNLLDKTLELAQKVVQPVVDKEKEVVEVKKEPRIKEVIYRVYKEEIDSTNRIYVGTKTLNDGIIFRVAPQARNSQNSWKVYSQGFSYQKETWYYDNETVKFEESLEFIPSTKIQEIESSDRKGVIGYVEHKAGVVEVIYYDRFVN